VHPKNVLAKKLFYPLKKVLKIVENSPLEDFVTAEHCTVKKLRSLTLLFSCIFHIGRKPVHDGAENIITLY
jgi:hypothetical protein